MLFNSFAFAVFLPVAFALYWWAFRGLRVQNAFVLLASWLFYAWWDWRFLSLLLVSTAADFIIGLRIHEEVEDRRRKAWLWASIALNLGMLGFFKYFGFFVHSTAKLLSALGFEPHLPVLKILLPVGISFYTFQTLSYTIDIYRRQFTPTRDPVSFGAFVAFFPQLVAGPIERARDLLPQFERPRVFDRALATDGLRQMLWGFFKKIAVADQLGAMSTVVFNLDPRTTSGVTLFFGALAFAFQIYADFSGYSDIAIGCARLFGFSLSRNFNYPYFSRSIGEFWRRWHLSLSSWLRDYVYLSLGGSREPRGRLRNILITFGISGLWHGAAWTFVGWGLVNGLYYVPEVLRGKRTKISHAPNWREIPRMLSVFALVLVAWVLFRAHSIELAGLHLFHIAANALVRPYDLIPWITSEAWWFVAVMLAVEWNARREQHGLSIMPRRDVLRWLLYLLITLAILLRMELYSENAFIYFRF